MEAITVTATSDNSEVSSSSPAFLLPSLTVGANPLKVAGVTSDGDLGSADEEFDGSRRRRELLARRPSYRKILNELSSPEGHQMVTLPPKVEEDSTDSSGDESDQPTNLTTSATSSAGYPGAAVTVVPAGALQLTSDGSGIQTLTMTNDSSVKSAASSTPQGATLVQYAPGPDGQFFLPGSVQYQLAPQGVVMATPGSGMSASQNVPEEASRKRELRLLKNREAARECRRKKKEYVKCLENRVAVLENQNKTLIEELKSLKELYCQKEAHS